MSSKDLADYLEQRVAMLGISRSEVARRADISRQTWYRLLSADLTDAKLSTIMRLAEALETPPLHLLCLYLGEGQTTIAYNGAVNSESVRDNTPAQSRQSLPLGAERVL